MSVTYEELEKQLVDAKRPYNMEKIRAAYEYAAAMHDGQFRKSGEPYIIHPLCVAIILADLELEKDDPLEDVLRITMENQELTHTPYPVDAKMIHEAILKLEDYRG